jgi:mannose-6-phosphate isomerase-like protein (cupin superfamily)
VDGCIADLILSALVDIPVGTVLQYRCESDEQLNFICTAVPPWPGDSAATRLDWTWELAI